MIIWQVIIFDVQTCPALIGQGGLKQLLESEHIIKVTIVIIIIVIVNVIIVIVIIVIVIDTWQKERLKPI